MKKKKYKAGDIAIYSSYVFKLLNLDSSRKNVWKIAVINTSNESFDKSRTIEADNIERLANTQESAHFLQCEKAGKYVAYKQEIDAYEMF